jgi:threonine/homoserine/homoserine lactone efflux protein
MQTVSLFSIAFAFSFIGSIPPGSLNLSILQLGLSRRMAAAWRFALAAAIIEYFYTWAAVRFESLILNSVTTFESLQLFTAGVMIVLGIVNLRTSEHSSRMARQFDESGFRKGFLLALLNPMALPFWVAMTAYLKAQGWIELQRNVDMQLYLMGVSLGGFTFLMSVAYLSKNMRQVKDHRWLKRAPGILLLLLGFYALAAYLLK